VKRILSEHGIYPAPERGKRTPWKTFIKVRLGKIAEADFFTVEVLSLVGNGIRSALSDGEESPGAEQRIDHPVGDHGGCHGSCELPRATRLAAPALLPRSCVRPVVIRLAESATARVPLRPDSGPTSRTAVSASQAIGSDLPRNVGIGGRNTRMRLRNVLRSRRNCVDRILKHYGRRMPAWYLAQGWNRAKSSAISGMSQMRANSPEY
jgi:hypothetical protein